MTTTNLSPKVQTKTSHLVFIYATFTNDICNLCQSLKSLSFLKQCTLFGFLKCRLFYYYDIQVFFTEVTVKQYGLQLGQFKMSLFRCGKW